MNICGYIKKGHAFTCQEFQGTTGECSRSISESLSDLNSGNAYILSRLFFSVGMDTKSTHKLTYIHM